ncbi:MAG: helix-turn-helix domain-containing protein [Clostridia bacterium]|nr:helix-turn-helix domain-containing protein [Clostridia bacterium]
MSDELLSLFYPLSEDEAKLANGLVRAPDRQKAEPETLRRDLLLQHGKLIAVSQHGRFDSTPLHRHDFVEMEYMLHGSAAQMIDGKRVVLQQGDLLIMNRYVQHTIEKCGREDIMINIMALPEYFDRVLTLSGLEDSPMRRFFLGCILAEDESPDYLLFNLRELYPVRHLIENLLWTLKNDVPYRQSTNQLTLALALQLLQYHADSVRSGAQSTDILWTIQQYIDTRYADGSLEDAARVLHYDFRWLSHEIKRRTGKTFTELMQERRLQQAVWYLKNTAYSVPEICERIGYVNLTYFYKVFKARFGVTPKEFRISGIGSRESRL